MKGVPVVVLGQHVFLLIQDETAVGDAVGIASDGRTKVRRDGHVILDVVKSEDDVTIDAVPVRDHDGHDAAAEIGDADLHPPAVGQGIEPGLGTVHFRDEICRVQTRLGQIIFRCRLPLTGSQADRDKGQGK